MTTVIVHDINELYDVLSADIQAKLDELTINAGILEESLYKNGTSLTKVASILNAKYKWLTPVKDINNKDLQKAIEIIIDGLSKDIFNTTMVLNTIKATLVNPINRMEYGHNAPSTIKAKGFDKVMVNTGKFLRSINALMEK